MTVTTDTDLTQTEPRALDPAALSLTDTARVLSAAKNGKVTVEMLQADVDAGAPTAPLTWSATRCDDSSISR